jgi:hypothetical protein
LQLVSTNGASELTRHRAASTRAHINPTPSPCQGTRRTFSQRDRCPDRRRSPAASFSQGGPPAGPDGDVRPVGVKRARPLAPPPRPRSRPRRLAVSPAAGVAVGRLWPGPCARARAHLGVHVNVHAPRVPGATCSSQREACSPSISSAPAGRGSVPGRSAPLRSALDRRWIRRIARPADCRHGALAAAGPPPGPAPGVER